MTGAAGFVGANLVRRALAAGHAVTAVVRPGSDRWRLEGAGGDLRVLEVDLCDPAAPARAITEAKPQWVFHLAAHGSYSWQSDTVRIVTTNVLGTLHLVEACRAGGVESFVHAGSSSEYGLKDHAPAEDERPEPNSPYAFAKLSATLYCRQVARAEQARLTTLRLYSVYGPWEAPRRLVSGLAVAGLAGGFPPLSSPGTARDFVYVDDICDAFLSAAAAPVEPGAIFNLASGIQTTIRDAAAVAKRVCGIAAEPSFGSMPDRAWDTTCWVGNPALVRGALGWTARTAFEEGFRRTVEWFRAHPEVLPRYTNPA